MKRFMLFIAMVGFVATSCSKTIVKDEVETAISFSTESSKLTRAIVDDNAYLDAQPFGVFAYAHQGNTTDKLMDTVHIVKKDGVWKSNVGKYYWPNDPTTSIDFYAYSPVINAKNDVVLADHQKMTVTGFKQEDKGAMSFTAYTHSNMYVDFMVATPVKGATYVNPDGDPDTPTAQGKEGVVPVVFKHQMSQILFKVTTLEDYGTGITFTLNSITLKNIKDKADFNHSYADDTQDQEQYDDSHVGIWSNQVFSDQNNKRVYPIFPATTNLGAPNDEQEANIVYVADVNTANNVFTTTGVTMIPQDMAQCNTAYVAGQDKIADETVGQMFEIVYSISGTGVANETVTKHIPFYPHADDLANQTQAGSFVNWGPNKRITYVVKIGLNEVKFEPSVSVWEDTAGNEYSFVQ